MWEYHDNNMYKLKQLYLHTNKQTQNRLQEIFDSINFKYDSLYNIASFSTKSRVDIYINEWKEKGLLNGYFGLLANDVYRRSKVKNSEILELFIYEAYIEEQSKLDTKEQKIMKDDANYYYQQGQKEVNDSYKDKRNKMLNEIEDDLFIILISQQAIIRGYTYTEYIRSVIKYNADTIYKQVVQDMQDGKELNIANDIYQNILKKQINSKISINDNKISGSMDNIMLAIDNLAKVNGISTSTNAKCKFIAVEDNKTTKMCHSLDGQVFNIHDWNTFYRFSDSNKAITKYKCYGMIPGLNLPPIDDNFHYCRSTIKYERS